MPVIVNGSTGITTPASNTTGTQTVTTLSSPAATALTIQSGGTTAMTIDTSGNVTTAANLTVTGTLIGSTGVMNIGSGQIYKDANGNVGIGTTSPSTRLQTSTTSDGAQAIFVGAQSTNEQTLLFRNQYYTNNLTAGVAAIGWIDSGSSGGILTFKTGTNGGGVTNIPTERARIDNSGNFLVGTTSYAAGQNSIKLSGSSSNFSRSSTAASAQIYFENPNGTVGQISTSGSATSYLTSSDYRLKEDVEALTSGLSTVSAMRPVSYKWKVDGGVGNGFIAHELQAIVPDAVSGEKDAVNEDGSIRPQGVDYSKIVVHLVAAIQELSAKNDALEAINAAFEVRLAALEAK